MRSNPEVPSTRPSMSVSFCLIVPYPKYLWDTKDHPSRGTSCPDCRTAARSVFSRRAYAVGLRRGFSESYTRVLPDS